MGFIDGLRVVVGLEVRLGLGVGILVGLLVVGSAPMAVG